MYGGCLQIYFKFQKIKNKNIKCIFERYIKNDFKL